MATNEKDLIRLSKDIYHAITRNELDRFESHLASDVELFDQTSARILRGPREVADFYRTFLTAFPDTKLDIDHQLASGNTAINEIRVRATHNGPLRTPDGGEVPATGRKIDYPCCEVWEFQGDKVKSIHLYADFLAVRQQLGLAPQTQPQARIYDSRATVERRDVRGPDQPRL